MISAEREARLPPLDGGRNFRDLGGYPAADGRRIKWGKIYRSGALSAITPAGYGQFDALGIKLVCDLRTPSERIAEPFRNAGANPVIHRTWEYLTDSRPLAAQLRALGGDVSGIRQAIFGIYRNLPWEFADRYRDILGHLVRGDTPLVFNCSAGKDRTGVAAALLLCALGVPHQTILDDYSLTETLLDFAPLLDDESGAATGFHFVRQLQEPARSLLLRSDPDYLEAGLAAVEIRAGSIDAYLERHLGLDRQAKAALREHLLE